MEGVLIGDSQLKFLSRRRLHFAAECRTCTFSVGGSTATSLTLKLQRWQLKRVDFAVLYVGGNELSNGRPPDIIVRDILHLVDRLSETARVVFLCKLLPRCGVDREAEAGRLLLNRLLARGVRRMPDVVLINPDPYFLTRERVPKRHLYATDGYHLSRHAGIRTLARLLKVAVRKRLGSQWVGDLPRLELAHIHVCCHCKAKGHKSWACLDYQRRL